MAVWRADALVNRALQTRGFPMADFEEQAANVSVEHPQVVENYRIAQRSRFGTSMAWQQPKSCGEPCNTTGRFSRMCSRVTRRGLRKYTGNRQRGTRLFPAVSHASSRLNRTAGRWYNGNRHETFIIGVLVGFLVLFPLVASFT